MSKPAESKAKSLLFRKLPHNNRAGGNAPGSLKNAVITLYARLEFSGIMKNGKRSTCIGCVHNPPAAAPPGSAEDRSGLKEMPKG
jgi:hypothetical protein